MRQIISKDTSLFTAGVEMGWFFTAALSNFLFYRWTRWFMRGIWCDPAFGHWNVLKQTVSGVEEQWHKAFLALASDPTLCGDDAGLPVQQHGAVAAAAAGGRSHHREQHSQI